MTRRLDRFLAVTIVVLIGADWLSKFLVINRMALGESVALIDGWLYFVHRQNPGVAFSMFADLPDGWRMPLLTGLSLVGVVIFGRMVSSGDDRIVRIAAAVVLAGALGNLGDRLLNGFVTDFVLVRYFPFVFNVADASISVGGVVLAVRLFLMDGALDPSPVAKAP